MVIMSSRMKLNEAEKIEKESSQLEFRCIVTGFNGFGPNTENPSQLVAQNLPIAVSFPRTGEVKITSLVLPTCCSQAWDILKTHLKRKSKVRNIVILTGLAAKRDRINLERMSVNVRDYAIKDSGGHKYDGKSIDDGPLALKTDAPLFDFRRKLQAAGFPTVISNHAGTFVCNDVYYRSLFFQLKHGSPDLVLFVHVPRLMKFRKTVQIEGNQKTRALAEAARTRTKQIELMQAAIIEVIKASVSYLTEIEAAERRGRAKSTSTRSSSRTATQRTKKLR
jgi:pyroglutamyl-peptidase